MAIYSNLNALPMGMHGVWESSLLKSQLSGHIWDCLVVEETTTGSGASATTTRTPINCDNGVAVRVGDFVTGENNTQIGLQERYATIAGVKDKIGVVGSVPIIKDARTALEETEPYFYNKAGQDSKVYEVVGDEYDGDIFGVGLHQFTTATQTLAKTLGSYVVVDGNGKWVAQAAKPTASAYGFIGRVHSTWTNNDYTIVRIYAIQNKDNN